ncbi:NADH:ubiquinone oxidoreductase, membrane subunit L [Candidatus Methylobacter favarea]|uniref:NADH:ubiquinone oxidoreductase, membrane subunit L n=1 Tax=Candidatus Methylobacter favarea TaxID=2707345 RepID=A0A8S0X253_9GAMM|nr:NADH-quinone oxidoreductase subunit L [Candidatus Methylobacter favarea]CAA9891642.1 NADH:ubiquinone oxidoreductase, membrane subunit L [Candidatus Methylobacter favarea]
MIELLGWVPFLPFLGFLILAIAGERLSRRLIPWIGAGSVGISALLTALIGAQFLKGAMPPYRLALGSWMAVDNLSVPFGFYLDPLSMTMLFVVTGVGFLIHVYSAEFMESDPGYARFFAYMNLFVSAMLVLVLADNLVLLYLGWEGVGLGSYLLIGFWYEDPNNGYAARKAFVMTRAGDTSMAIGLFLLFTQLHTFDIQSVMTQATNLWTPGTVLPVAAAALLLGGAVGKSAQLPLQSWLPDAMAGPTPVSALIHAATMVTAGVYLIARTHALFMLAPSVQFAVAVIGAVTLLMAGCSALAQTDIKRILAYSTISQIGYMFLALGVGAWSAAIFHLLTHAFFKALLFLAAGAVILCFHHEHNIFRMGGLRKSMPLAFLSFMIGSAALSGLPFTSGYYSKHEILLAAFEVSPVLWTAGCLGALITGIYSFRLVFVAFFGPQHAQVEKSPGWRMSAPLLLLCILALAGAMLEIPLASVFSALAADENLHELNTVSAITVAAPFIGVLIAGLFYLTGAFSTQRLESLVWIRQIQRFFFSGWGMDAFYNILLVRPFKTIARLNKNDAVDSIYSATAFLSLMFHRLFSSLQTGQVRWYASSMVLGTIVIIAIGWLS